MRQLLSRKLLFSGLKQVWVLSTEPQKSFLKRSERLVDLLARESYKIESLERRMDHRNEAEKPVLIFLQSSLVNTNSKGLRATNGNRCGNLSVSGKQS